MRSVASVNAHANGPEPLDRAVRIREADRVLVVAPHPDDESLATAGLLLAARSARAQMRVVYLTDGDNNPWAQLVTEWRWPLTADRRALWGRRRRLEALAALRRLGVPEGCVRFLGFPDQALTDLLMAGEDSPIQALVTEVGAWHPTMVAAPSPRDHHPDHGAAGVMVSFALARLSPEARPSLALHYLVHAERDPAWGRRWVALDPGERERKRRAILCHASQLFWRRRRLLSFAQDEEVFEAAAVGHDRDEGQPVRAAFRADGALRGELESAQRLGLGKLILRMAAEDGRGRRLRLSVPMRRRLALQPDRDTSANQTLGEPSRPHVRHGGELTLGAGQGPTSWLCFIKLERPLERRLGFFDRAGWSLVPAPQALNLRGVRDKVAGGTGAVEPAEFASPVSP